VPEVDVLVVVPYALGKAAGNVISALRLQRQLEDGGLSVRMVELGNEMPEARCLVALNAWRCSEVIQDFQGAVVVMLTGTDVNDVRVDDPEWAGRRAMERADRLVVLQEEAYQRVPSRLRDKCEVVFPSVELPEGLSWTGGEGSIVRVLLAGRDRPEKQIDLVLEACRRLPEDAAVSVEWYGAQRSEDAQHFQWKGSVSQEDLWREMARADFFMNASSEEGGANAVCEAIAIGIPVLASRIGGNVGMLGEDYEGYFESGDVEGLVKLLTAANAPVLRGQIEERQSLFGVEREAAQWVDLVRVVMS